MIINKYLKMDNSKPPIIYLLFGYQNNKRHFNTKLLGIYYTLEEVQKRQNEICLDKSKVILWKQILLEIKNGLLFYRQYFYGDNYKELNFN